MKIVIIYSPLPW